MSQLRGASRPGGAPPGQDRWLTLSGTAAVLDGASTFDLGRPSADLYVDRLMTSLRHGLAGIADLRAVLEDAITDTTQSLGLQPRQSPCSTVVLLRERNDALDLTVLGDSTALIGLHTGDIVRLTDARLATVAAGERRRYRSRLRAGAGYDEQHRRLLRDIQQIEVKARNTNGGYWIAEADAAAAQHALHRRYPISDVAWGVLATDGAQRLIDHLRIPWADIAKRSERELADLLDQLHLWESTTDPHAVALPRAKRHDDKTLVTWSPT